MGLESDFKIMSINDPFFPNTIWAGQTPHRKRRELNRAPDYEDWDQIVAELIATQVYATGLVVGSSPIQLDPNAPTTFAKTPKGIGLRYYGASSGYIGFAVGANVGPLDFTLPSADGSTDQAITTNGSTILGWTSFIKSSALDTDATLSANSDSKIASQKAVKAYADQLISAANATVYKGALDCSANPNYPAANAGDLYFISVAGKIGGLSGVAVEIGDMAICLADNTASGNQATVGASWNVIQANKDGILIGPASATDGSFPLFSGTTGKLLQSSIYSPSSFALSATNTGDQTTTSSDGSISVSNGTTNPALAINVGHANAWTAAQSIQTGSAGTPPLILKGAASQTANLFEVRASDNTLYSATGPSGLVAYTPAASTTGSPTLVTLTGPAHTSLTASTEAIDFDINMARVVQFSTGTLALQRTVAIRAATLAAVGASTITTAASLHVSGGPLPGTNVTITGAYAARFLAGLCGLSVPLALVALTSKSLVVSNKALTTNVATLTTSASHGFFTGETVTVAGVDATFNGVFVITGVPTVTTFTYAKTAANVTSQSAVGTAVVAQSNDIFQTMLSGAVLAARITSAGCFSNSNLQTGTEIFGDGATAASTLSVAFGNAATCAGGSSVAIGNAATCAGANSFAAGQSASAPFANSVAVGQAAAAGSTNTTAVGKSASVSGAAGTALGQGATCASASGVAIGSSASTGSANNVVTIGNSATAGTGSTGGIAIGTSATIGASHLGSIVIGHNAVATASGQFIASSSDASITDMYYGNGVTNATPAAVTIHGCGGTGANVAGALIVIGGGIGTGTGVGGNVAIQVALASGSSSSTANTLANALVCSGTDLSTSVVGVLNLTTSLQETLFDNGASGTSKAIAWANGNIQKVSVTGACTFTFTAPAKPGKFKLLILQDATGHAITLPTIIWPAGTAPTWSSAANKKDILSVLYDGTTYWGLSDSGVAFA